MIVAFIGHSEKELSNELKEKLKEVIEDCIKKGADTFYCGGYNPFDTACANAVFELKSKYPVKSFWIIPYYYPVMKKKIEYIKKNPMYDGSFFPNLENITIKDAIYKRNNWMADNSDIIIYYADYNHNNIFSTLKYAQNKNKTILILKN